MAGSRVLRASTLAFAVAWLVSTHVFVAIDLMRFKLVQSSLTPVDGLVQLTTNDVQGLERLRPPFALIAHIRNQSTSASAVQVYVDGDRVCERHIPGRVVRRVDCAVASWTPGKVHGVTVKLFSADWTLEYLELASHHGNGSGGNYFVVLPASADSYVRPAFSWVVVTWLVMFLALTPNTSRSLPVWATRLGTVLAGIISVLLVVVQFSEWVSPYRVVLSAGTVTRWLVLALASRLWPVMGWVITTDGQAPSAKRGFRQLIPLMRAAAVALVVLAVCLSLIQARLEDSYRGNYSGLLLVAETTFDRNPLLQSRGDIRKSLVLNRGGGYDAQFMYFAAFDPLLRAFKDDPAMYRRVMDDAPYRFGRIGYSWLTWIFSAGRWERYPTTMIWLILSSLALASFTLAFMAQERGLSAGIGALVIAVPGFWPSLQSGLPEPIAAATLLGGIFFLSRSKPWIAGLLFALSLLTRETGLVIVACTVAASMVADRKREALIVALLSGSALLAWRLYVAWILFPDWRLHGLLFTGASNFTWPLVGIRDLWLLIAHGQYLPNVPEVSRAAVALPILLIGGFLLALALAMTRYDATSAAALVYGLMAICLNYAAVWLFVGNAQRVTYELFLTLALSCLAIREYSGRLRGGLIAFWSCSVLYVFFLTFDASYIRSALAIPF